jgi:diguanylate cyclase (GGDEF)-like protein
MQNNATALKQALTQALKTLVEVNPSQRSSISAILDNVKNNDLSFEGLTKEIRKVGADVIQAKDKESLDFRMAAQDVMTGFKRLKGSEHLSSKQMTLLDRINESQALSPIESLTQLNEILHAFADEAIRHRKQSKVIVGTEHGRLKKTPTNVIAGDVAWSSKHIIKSITPLLLRLHQEFPDKTNVQDLYQKVQIANKQNVVDFFEALTLMEACMRELTKLQGKKNNAEAEYLKSFHIHLKSMHTVLTLSIKDNTEFDSSSKKDNDAMHEIMNGFKDAAKHENDPEILKKIISDNVKHMQVGFEKAMKRQNNHLLQQQRRMENLQTDIRAQDKKRKQIQKEKESLTVALQSMENLSLNDELTNIGNRRSYDQYLLSLDNSLKSEHNPEECGIIVVDVDHFKKINDQFGHQIGDKVLTKVASLLSAAIKNKKLNDKIEIFRYGGEEFALIYKNIELRSVIKFTEYCRRNMEARNYTLKEHVIKVTASFGISTYSNKTLTGESVFDQADQALYRAKKSGRNRIAFNKGGSIHYAIK